LRKLEGIVHRSTVKVAEKRPNQNLDN